MSEASRPQRFSAAEIHWAPRIHQHVPQPLDVLYFMSLFRKDVRKKGQSNYLIKEKSFHSIQDERLNFHLHFLNFLYIITMCLKLHGL